MGRDCSERRERELCYTHPSFLPLLYIYHTPHMRQAIYARPISPEPVFGALSAGGKVVAGSIDSASRLPSPQPTPLSRSSQAQASLSLLTLLLTKYKPLLSFTLSAKSRSNPGRLSGSEAK
jgi:hypothetical protein